MHYAFYGKTDKTMEKVCGIGMTVPIYMQAIDTHLWRASPTTFFLSIAIVYLTALNGRSVRIQNTSIGIYKRNIGVIDVLSEEEGEVKGKSNYGQIQGSGLMSYTVLLALSYS